MRCKQHRDCALNPHILAATARPGTTCSHAAEYSVFTHKPATGGASNIFTWKYWNGGQTALSSSGASSWVNAGFSDASWKSGASPLGYGPDLPWGTAVEDNSRMPAGGIAYYYFRAVICLPTPLAPQVHAVCACVFFLHCMRVLAHSLSDSRACGTGLDVFAGDR